MLPSNQWSRRVAETLRPVVFVLELSQQSLGFFFRGRLVGCGTDRRRQLDHPPLQTRADLERRVGRDKHLLELFGQVAPQFRPRDQLLQLAGRLLANLEAAGIEIDQPPVHVLAERSLRDAGRLPRRRVGGVNPAAGRKEEDQPSEGGDLRSHASNGVECRNVLTILPSFPQPQTPCQPIFRPRAERLDLARVAAFGYKFAAFQKPVPFSSGLPKRSAGARGP